MFPQKAFNNFMYIRNIMENRKNRQQNTYSVLWSFGGQNVSLEILRLDELFVHIPFLWPAYLHVLVFIIKINYRILQSL